MNKTIKLFAVYNEEQKELKNWFENSIKDDFELNIEKLQLNGGDFKTSSFNEICKRKFKLLLEAIKDNQGDIIISSDLDIQFFRKCEPLIRELIIDKDIVTQLNNHPIREGEERKAHIGFMAIKCNEINVSLFEEVVKIMEEHGDLQDMLVINRLLATNFKHLRLGFFPRTIWHQRYSKEPPEDIILHHAIQWGETGAVDREKRIQLKMDQLVKIKRLVES